MSDITWVSPHGYEIVGTLERLDAYCPITGIEADGTPIHKGNTEIDWESQESQKRDGKILFLCENDDHWTFDQLMSAEAWEAANQVPEPEPGQLWRHCKGTVYEILTVDPLRDEDDDEKVVRYRTAGTDEAPHSRTMSNFLSEHSSGKPRFTRIDGEPVAA